MSKIERFAQARLLLDRDATRQGEMGHAMESLLHIPWEREDLLTLPQRRELPPQRRRRNRVVITGLGAVTPLGPTVKDLWEGLLAGRSGIGRIAAFDASPYSCRIAGEVRGFTPQADKLPRYVQFALAATRQALEDAAFEPPFDRPERVGVVMGIAFPGSPMPELKGLEPIAAPSFHVACAYGARGYNLTVSTACASGAQAVGEAAEAIRRGAAEVVIAGGTEALSQPLLAAFASLGLLSSCNEEPERACRPFDARRDGLVLGEGAGVLILESLPHALQREALIYAEVLGYAANSNAYSLTTPEPEAQGAIQAMSDALADADLDPAQVDYINAHGASSPLGDIAETWAIKGVFGERAYHIPISATKSMTGHLLGAAGAVEAIVCALTLDKGYIHPTINYQTPDPNCDLDYVPNMARAMPVDIVLSNSFGLGGQNTCLVLGRYRGGQDAWQGGRQMAREQL